MHLGQIAIGLVLGTGLGYWLHYKFGNTIAKDANIIRGGGLSGQSGNTK